MSDRYYLVDGHLGHDYWVRVDESDPDQEEYIEEVCDQCFDSDYIIDIAGTLEEAKALCGKHYHTDYGREMYLEFKELMEARDERD